MTIETRLLGMYEGREVFELIDLDYVQVDKSIYNRYDRFETGEWVAELVHVLEVIGTGYQVTNITQQDPEGMYLAYSGRYYEIRRREA